MVEPINIFISHCGIDADSLIKVRDMLKRRGFSVRDSSIDERNPNKANNPDYIKSLIRPQIEWAGTIIVLIGPKTHTREWVNWEIEYASSFGNKRIVGIYLRGATNADVPENLNKYGDALVPWNSEKLASAIDGEDIWHDTDDQPRPGKQFIRSKC